MAIRQYVDTNKITQRKNFSDGMSTKILTDNPHGVSFPQKRYVPPLPPKNPETNELNDG